MSAREDAERIRVSLRTVSGILEQLRLGLHEQVSKLLREAAQRQSAAPEFAADSQRQGPAADAAAGADSNVIPDSEEGGDQEQERRAMDQAAHSARSLGQGSGGDGSFEGDDIDKQALRDNYSAFKDSVEDLHNMLETLQAYPQPHPQFVYKFIEKIKKRLNHMLWDKQPRRRMPVTTGKRAKGGVDYGGPSRGPPPAHAAPVGGAPADANWPAQAGGRPAASQEEAIAAAAGVARAVLERTTGENALEKLKTKWQKDSDPEMQALAASAERRLKDLRASRRKKREGGLAKVLARLDATRKQRRRAARLRAIEKHGTADGEEEEEGSAELDSAGQADAEAEALRTRRRKGGVPMTKSQESDKRHDDARYEKELQAQLKQLGSKKKRRAVIDSDSD